MATSLLPGAMVGPFRVATLVARRNVFLRPMAGIAWTMLLLAAVRETPAQTPAPGTRASTPDWSAFDAYVSQAARSWHVPALAIAVVKDDSLVFARGYGVLEIGTDRRAGVHTRFAIGSTTKAMTAAAIAMLVDDGKLKFDDRVIDFLPELRLYDPYVARELTIRDLLTHRSGLESTDLLWYRWNYPPAEILRRLRYVRPASSFRSGFAYQNVMYGLTGLIIERASGMPWAEFMRRRLFLPLGMNETEPLVSLISGKPNVAVPYLELNDTVRKVPVHSTDAVAAAGSVWSSVADLSRWMRFMLDSGRVGSQRLIQPATFRELVTPQIPAPPDFSTAMRMAPPHVFAYALGWFVEDYAQLIVWMHMGNIDGMSALVGLLPGKHVGVYVLTNLEHTDLPDALIYRGFDLYGTAPARDWSADERRFLSSDSAARPPATPLPHTDTHPGLALERYTGLYTDSTYGDVRVCVAHDRLRAKVVSDSAQDLEHVEFDTFKTRGSDPVSRHESVLTFLPDGAGGVSAVRVSAVPFGAVTFTRVPLAESRH